MACESAGLTAPVVPVAPAAASGLSASAGLTISEDLSGPSGSTDPITSADGTPWPRDLEVVRRSRPGRRYTFLINHGADAATVLVDDRTVSVPGGDVRVITDLPGLPD
jgi:hypothetical protein